MNTDMLQPTQPEQLPVCPSLLIGVGEGGRRIASRVTSTLDRVHPKLQGVIGFLRLDHEGLHPLDLSPSVPITKPLSQEEALALLQGFHEEATSLLGENLRRVHRLAVRREVERAGYRVQPGTDIYLTGSLEEPFSRVMIPAVTTLLEGAYRSWRDVTLSVLLVLPSEHVLWGGEEGTSQLRAMFEDLKRYLAGPEDVPIDYCYLIDWSSLDSAQQGEEVAAALLTLVVNSALSSNSSYEELKLLNLREASALPGAGGLCSGIGYSAYVLPIESLIRYCAHRLGASLIEKGLQGEPAEEEYSTLERMLVHTGLIREEKERRAEPLAVRLMVEGGLGPDRILSDLKRDEEGRPLRVAFDPKEMRDVVPEELIDRILSLDAFFGRNEIPKYRKQMEKRKAEIEERIQTLIADLVDSCITTLPRGLQTARDLGKRLSEKTAEEMEREEQVPSIPDLDGYCQRLEEAILHRPRWGAVIARFFVLALFEAYVIPSLYTLLYPEPSSLIRSILIAGVVFLNVLLAAVIIFLAESRVSRAYGDFIGAVAEKYEIIIDHWARRYRKSVQEAMLDCLEGEKKALSAWENKLKETQEVLLEGAEGERYTPHPMEISLVENDDYQTWYDQRVTWKVADLTEDYLRVADLGQWREATPSSLRNSVYEFCLGKCRNAFERISLERYLVESQRDPRDVMEGLEAWAKPLLRYGRRLTKAEIPLKILAVTDAEDTIMNQEAVRRSNALLVSTGDRERLSYFHTVHGIALEDLDIVRLLREERASGDA